jgi:hypothetical protein
MNNEATLQEIRENWKTYTCPNCGDVCDIDVNDAVNAWHHRWISHQVPSAAS